MSSPNTSFEIVDEQVNEPTIWTDEDLEALFDDIRNEMPQERRAIDDVEKEEEEEVDDLSYEDYYGDVDHDVMREMLRELRAAKDGIEREKEDHRKTLEKLYQAEATIEEQRIVRHELEEKVMDLEDDSTYYEKAAWKMETEVKWMWDELKVTSTELKEEKEEHRETISKLQDAEAQLANSATQDETMTMMKELLEKLKIQDDVIELQKENEALRQENLQIQDLQAQNEALTHDLWTLKEANEELTEENLYRKQESEELRDKLEELMEQNSELQEKCSEFSVQLEKLAEESTELKSELNKDCQGCAALRSDLGIMYMKNQRTRHENQVLKEEALEEFSELEEEVEKLEKANANLKEAATNLQASLDYKAYESTVRSEVIQKLKAEREGLRKAVKESTERHCETWNQKKAFERLLATKERTIEALERTIRRFTSRQQD